MAASHAFPASAAKSLVDGYCQDFVSLAASLAQTLEQMRMRGIPFDSTREALARTERGMRDLAEAIQDALSGAQLLPPDAPAAPASAAVAQSPAASTVRGAESNAAAPRAAPAGGPGGRASGAKSTAAADPGTRSGEVRPGVPRTARPPSPPAAAPIPVAQPTAAVDPPSPVQTGGVAHAGPPEPNASSVAPTPPADHDRPPVVRPAGSEELQGLVGTSETMPLLSVFQFLNRVRKSGTLHVDADGELMTFEFVAGIIEFTTSSRAEPRERLGEILGAMFPMLRESVESFLQQNEPLLHSRRLGGVLVGKGIATNGQVMEALERQVLTRFRRATKASLAKYRFEEGERVPGDGRIRIRPFELMHQNRRPG